MACVNCNKSFSSNYMILKPNEASFVEVMKILFSSDVAKQKFVERSEGVGDDHETLWRRIVIFVSVVVQKVLLAMAEPLARFGEAVENWLNLVSQNGGFFGLLINLLKGEVVYPDITSSSFLSFIGNIDKRMELESKIKHEDARYYAALSIMAAKASYENHNYVHSVVNDGRWISLNIKLIGTVVDEEPDKNYFSIIWVIPKIVNGWWELMRSFFIIPPPLVPPLSS